MCDCASVLNLATRYFLACEEGKDTLSQIFDHIANCPDCKAKVAVTYSLGKLIEEVGMERSEPEHCSDFELVSLLLPAGNEGNENRMRVKEHVENCEGCSARLADLTVKQQSYVQQFNEDPSGVIQGGKS